MSLTCSGAYSTHLNSIQDVLTCLLNSQCIKVQKLTTHLLGIQPKFKLILLLGGAVARQANTKFVTWIYLNPLCQIHYKTSQH